MIYYHLITSADKKIACIDDIVRELKEFGALEVPKEDANLIFLECKNIEDLKEVDSGQKAILLTPVCNLTPETRQQFSSALEMPNLLGVVDTSVNFNFAKNWLVRLFEQFSVEGTSSSDLKKIGRDLEKVVAHTIAELQRVKKLHTRLVPIRSDKIKGLELTSKFAAGVSSGGEFFDVVTHEKELVFFFTSTTSYVASSIGLTHFSDFASHNDFNDKSLRKLIEGLIDEVDSLSLLSEKGNEAFQLFLMKLDLRTMEINGYHFGSTELVSSGLNMRAGNDLPFKKGFIDQAYFQSKLERSERIILLSPGVKKNCNSFLGDHSLTEFVAQQLEKSPRNALEEIFYQLKKIIKSEFLNHDASAIFFEVDKNAIIQV